MIKRLQKESFLEAENSRKFNDNIFISYRKKNRFRTRKKARSFEDRMKIVIEGQGGTITINEICKREGISSLTFHQWTQDFLKIYNVKSHLLEEKSPLEVKKFEIVIEGKTGETSVAEICRRENITHDTYLEWSASMLNLKRQNIEQYNFEKNPTFQKNKQLISRRSHADVFDYLDNYVDFTSNKSIVVLKSNSKRLDFIADIENVVSLQRINDVRYVNKYFEKVNSKMDNGGIFVGCFETLTARKNRKRITKMPILNNIYFSTEFLFKRILPKISLTKKYYFDITKGNDRLLSKAEGLGRLVSCGFKIMDFKTINGLLYFVVKKVKEPAFDLSPSYGPLYKMPRIGKNGKTIGVYKFRTMHPYSEYLQEFIINAYGYSKTGKPANDFRIPNWGRVMRKYWVDELPQLVNVLKGDMKLVGIRPLSMYRFSEIPKEMQKLRLPHRPGCIPPYLALNMGSDVMSLLQSERIYIEEKIKNPMTMDTICFFKAIYNIVFNNRRSA